MMSKPLSMGQRVQCTKYIPKTSQDLCPPWETPDKWARQGESPLGSTSGDWTGGAWISGQKIQGGRGRSPVPEGSQHEEQREE